MAFFKKYDYVITNVVCPWICGFGKGSDFAKKYIKTGNPVRTSSYYSSNNKLIEEKGEKYVYDSHMKFVFDDNNINYKLSKYLNEKVYILEDCMSGIYCIEITPSTGLVGRITGITKDNTCVIMTDDYLSFFGKHTVMEIEIKLLASMAIYKSKKGIYII